MNARTIAKRHFDKNPYRYLIAHLHPNRAQRRSEGRRNGAGKLIVESSRNFIYHRGMFATIEENVDA